MTGENNGMYMPVVPQGFGNNGFGFGGDNAWWIIILLIFMGGWGNGWNGNGVNGGVGSEVQRGFDQATLTNGLGNIQNLVTNGFANAEVAANSRQMADMNQMFALQSSMQNCCCENRAATADLKYTIASEACATRQANAQNTQTIMDKLCALELANVQQQLADERRSNDQLRTQLQIAQNMASQVEQTADIKAGQRALANEIEQYVVPTPRPAYVVQNPNCCSQNFGCGCGTA